MTSDITFDHYVDRAIRDFEVNRYKRSKRNVYAYEGNIYMIGLAEGLYADFLEEWFAVFGKKVKVCFFEYLKADSRLFMMELCNFLNLNPSVYALAKLGIENKTIEPKSKRLHDWASLVNSKGEKFLRRHQKIKAAIRSVYLRINEAKGQRKRENIHETTYKCLLDFYRFPNERLREILMQRGYQRLPGWLRS